MCWESLAGEAPEIIYAHGDIITGVGITTDHPQRVSAISVSKGYIVGAGTDGHELSRKGQQAEVVDLHGAFAMPSNGVFTTAFAAQALAAQGIAVLQMGWNPNNFDSPKQGPDQVRGFETAVTKLVNEGVTDPARVGAIGFSRSVYHVLFTLTADPPLLAAASVTDGVAFGYFEYISAVDGGRLDRFGRSS